MSKNDVPDLPAEEISCLRFPTRLEAAWKELCGYNPVSLADVFTPYLRLNDDVILGEPATPSECQLRMTAYLLRKRYTLKETALANTELTQLLVNTAMECTPYNYRGRRAR